MSARFKSGFSLKEGIRKSPPDQRHMWICYRSRRFWKFKARPMLKLYRQIIFRLIMALVMRHTIMKIRLIQTVLAGFTLSRMLYLANTAKEIPDGKSRAGGDFARKAIPKIRNIASNGGPLI